MARLLGRLATLRPQPPRPPADREALLVDYTQAEDALRAFTDRNFGRLCAICARWTLLAAKHNAAADAARASQVRTGAIGAAVEWPLQSWVTSCCNANHALESMSEASLAGIVASREEGQRWWEQVRQETPLPCSALTETGCALRRGRPELCNRYFCEAVRDYLWAIGGEASGPQLAAALDDVQRRWSALYATYQAAVRAASGTSAEQPADLAAVRREAGWDVFFGVMDGFDQAISRHARSVTAEELAERFFKVRGDESLYRPFFSQEAAAIEGHIRAEPQKAKRRLATSGIGGVHGGPGPQR